MAQVFYTGKDYKAPEPRGYAIQALTQFGGQEQARKTKELDVAYKERDRFAELLKMDPVYVSSRMAQERIGKILDDATGAMTKFYKDKKGPMSTADIIKLQAIKGDAMAQMGYIKSNNDRIVQAAQMYQANPGKYDAETWNKYFEQWVTEGTVPDENPLLPAVHDPFLSAEGILKSAGYKFTWTDAVGRQKISETEESVPMVGAWDLQGKSAEEVAASIASNPMQQWYIQKSFDRLPAQDKQEYVEAAGGNHGDAANMWFQTNMVNRLKARGSKTRSGRLYRGATDQQEKTEEKTYLSGPTQYIDNKPAFTKQKVFGAMIAKNGAEGVKFDEYMRKQSYSIPISLLTFSKSNLGLPEGTLIKVKPNISAEGKIEFAIDPAENTEIEITVDDYGKLPKNQRNKYTRIDNGEGNEDTFLYKEKMPENMSAIGNVEEVGTFLPSLFLEDYRSWFPITEQQEKPKRVSGWSHNMLLRKPKETLPSNNKYGL